MSKTRNQRRREQRMRQFALMALTAILTASVWISAALASDIGDRAKNRTESAAGAVDGFLPEDFDEDAYRAALDRYNAEEGLLLPQLTTEEGD